MSSSTLQAEVFIDETDNGKASSGYLKMISSEDLLIDGIGAEIHFEARGRMRSYKNTITSFSIIRQPKRLRADEEVILPFTFELSDENIESYEGRNVSFKYNCEVSIDVNKEDFNKLGLGFFSSIKSFITSNKTLRTVKEFEVKDFTNTYTVQEGTFGFKLGINYAVSIVVALLLILAYVFFMPAFSIGYVIGGILVIVVITYIIHSYFNEMMGKVTMKLSDTEEGFLCVVGKTKKFNLKDQILYYEIIEEVVDERGTKTSTSREVVYTSERKEMNNFKKNSEFKFSYVNNPDYESVEVKDVTILWRMNIIGISNLGLKLKYTSDFKVKKNKPIQDKEGLVSYS